MLAELELRFQPMETKIVPPSVSTVWSNHELEADHGGEMAAEKVLLQTTKHLFFLLWSEPPRHYTYLYVRNREGEPRHIEFKDSLPGEAARRAATNLLKNLELIGPEEQAPLPSNTTRQADGWSCGLWASRWVERQLRENRGEARSPPPSLGEFRTRANEFIDKIKTAKEHQAVVDVDKQRMAPRPTHEPEHGSLEDALEAALLCSKCLPTKAGTKGCRVCMGEYFEHIRQRRARGL
jgi:hypothetical protein